MSWARISRGSTRSARAKSTPLPSAVLQLRVRKIFKRHPEFTARQVVSSLGPERPAGYIRVLKTLRECRLAGARHSPAQRQIGWQLDGRTAARVRVSAIWKQHPEFTAKQVVRKLGPEHPVRLPWVQQILRDCWRASARHSPEQRRIGRRIYSPLRGLNRPLTASAPSWS